MHNVDKRVREACCSIRKFSRNVCKRSSCKLLIDCVATSKSKMKKTRSNSNTNDIETTKQKKEIDLMQKFRVSKKISRKISQKMQLTDFAIEFRKLNLDCFCASCLFKQMILIKRQIARFSKSRWDFENFANSLFVRTSLSFNKIQILAYFCNSTSTHKLYQQRHKQISFVKLHLIAWNSLFFKRYEIQFAKFDCKICQMIKFFIVVCKYL